MTRRVTVLAAAAVAAALAAAAAPQKTPPAPRGPDRAGQADRIFVNGRVWTGEPGRPLVEALAIRGKTVLAVGTSADIRKLSGKGTDAVDLRGRFAAPGCIDAMTVMDNGRSGRMPLLRAISEITGNSA